MNGRSENKRLAVLAYHRIGAIPAEGWDTWYRIPEQDFSDQMEIISNSGWQVINLSTFLAGLDRPETMPERGLLLTFDDGHKSMRDVALPILRRFGFPAVCFVPTDHIGTLCRFDKDVEPAEPICDWDDLHELDRCGVDIQSHGASHHWLSLLNHEQMEREFIRSKEVLEAGLGKPVETLAFPYSDSGKDDKAVDAALQQAGYKAAFLCGGGPNQNELPIRNPFCIDRLAVYRDTDLPSTFPKSPD
jgi:peptidoglycan/xylan/chitin deacetylase (PgdA/CDA1 family)